MKTVKGKGKMKTKINCGYPEDKQASRCVCGWNSTRSMRQIGAALVRRTEYKGAQQQFSCHGAGKHSIQLFRGHKLIADWEV